MSVLGVIAALVLGALLMRLGYDLIKLRGMPVLGVLLASWGAVMIASALYTLTYY